jgi:hypothetical protein
MGEGVAVVAKKLMGVNGGFSDRKKAIASRKLAFLLAGLIHSNKLHPCTREVCRVSNAPVVICPLYFIALTSNFLEHLASETGKHKRYLQS